MKRMKRWGLAAAIAAVIAMMALVGEGFYRTAQAVTLGDILALGSVVLVVSMFGDDIDGFINDALGQEDAELAGATKVVPILSVGQGTYVGAAQVVGVPSRVERVRVVAALDANIGDLEGTALVPISTSDPEGDDLDRVSGVGVSAVIDFRL